MSEYNTPLLIKRALVYQIQILPFEFDSIVSRYAIYKMPDEVLGKLKGNDLKKYIRALYLCSCEMANDWTRGHELLIELGFERKERREGHRCFVRMEWPETETVDHEGDEEQ